MPQFKLKVTATIIEHDVEANNLNDAITTVIGDLSTRFSANTEILSEETVVVDMTEYPA